MKAPLVLGLVLGLVALAILAPGCDREKKPETVATQQAPGEPEAAQASLEAPPMPKPLTLDREPPTLTTIDDAARARAQDLATSSGGKLGVSLSNRHNALALLHLAHTATDAELIANALASIALAYGPKQTQDERAFDADYFAVVRYRLASDEPQIENAAFEAARKGMKAEPVDAPLLALLLDRAYYHPKRAGRLLALTALAEMRAPPLAVDGAFHHALDDESTDLVALTLQKLGFFVSARLPDKARLERRLIDFLTHDDPRIRGMAAVALAEQVTYDDDTKRTQINGLITPLSVDPHWFVRLCALAARVEVDDPSVLSALVAALDDQTQTKLMVEGWVELDGSKGYEPLGRGIYGDTVSIAAVRMLQDATKGKPYAFDPTPPDFNDMPASHRRALAEAKAWAEQNAALVRQAE